MEEEEELDMTSVSLCDYIYDDALTIEDGLVVNNTPMGEEIVRDMYMVQVEEAMITFKRLKKESQRWDIVGDPTDVRIRQYYHRDVLGCRYMKIRAHLRCTNTRRISIMERDYCWLERRRAWDTQIHDIVQHCEYDCKQRGTLRLISCVTNLPWWLSMVYRRRLQGLQWDRYKHDTRTSTLLFNTITDTDTKGERPRRTVDVECFLGIHVRPDTVSSIHCNLDYIIKLPATVGIIGGFLFDHYYMRVLRQRMELYEHVNDNWETYYPNNGRVIR